MTGQTQRQMDQRQLLAHMLLLQLQVPNYQELARPNSRFRGYKHRTELADPVANRLCVSRQRQHWELSMCHFD
jgi:hypothetical protein